MSTFKAIQELLEGARGARNAIDDVDPQALQSAARNLVQRRRGREELTTPVTPTPSTTPTSTTVTTERSGRQQQQLQQRQEVLDPAVLRSINSRPDKYVYHGTSATKPFNEFDLGYLDKGEGAQVYGVGTYLGATPNISKNFMSRSLRNVVGPFRSIYNVTVGNREYEVFQRTAGNSFEFKTVALDQEKNNAYHDNTIQGLFRESKALNKDPEELVRSLSSEEGLKDFVVSQFENNFSRDMNTFDIGKLFTDRKKFFRESRFGLGLLIEGRFQITSKDFKAGNIGPLSALIRDYRTSGDISPDGGERFVKSFKEILISNNHPYAAFFNYAKSDEAFSDFIINTLTSRLRYYVESAENAKNAGNPDLLTVDTKVAESLIYSLSQPLLLLSSTLRKAEAIQEVKGFKKFDLPEEHEPYQGFARVTIPSAPISDTTYASNIWIHWQNPVPKDIAERFIDDFEVSEEYLNRRKMGEGDIKLQSGESFYRGLAEQVGINPKFEKIMLKRIKDTEQDPETVRRTRESLDRLAKMRENNPRRYPEAVVSEYLTRIGVTGITYKGSTHDRENFVIFDPRVARQIEWMSHERAEREAKQGTPPNR